MSDEQRQWTQIKTALTRAERTDDPAKILAACDKAEATFIIIGWPDWWSRIERMRSDNELRARLAERVW